MIGRSAAVDLVPGQLLTLAMLSDQVVPAADKATVGLALDPNRVPGVGLQPGDLVDVVAVPAPDIAADSATLDAPEVLAARAEIYGINDAVTAGGQLLLTLIVDPGEATRVATYSTQGRVAVIEVGRDPGSERPAAAPTSRSSEPGGGSS